MNNPSARQTLVVKFVAKGPHQQNHSIWLRQFPGAEGIWGPCRFIFDPDAGRYDWLVVYDDLPAQEGERFSTRQERLACSRQNTLLVTTEPITVKTYSAPFLAQFGHVLTSQEPAFIRHPQPWFSQAGLHWFYGVGRDRHILYDQLKMARPPEKSLIISTVCSSKRQKHTLHNRRYEFTLKLKAAMPSLNQFGHGVQLIDDKAEALDPYRYHLAIENHICRHHWTEKLADPFLAFCLPFYCGCTNLEDYFPGESFIPIDLFDFEKSLDTIRSAIAGNEYEKRLPAIIEARRLILEEYNLFAVLARFIEARHVSPEPGLGEMICSRHATRKKYPLHHLGDMAAHFFRRYRIRMQ